MKTSHAWLALALTATASLGFEPTARAQSSEADKAVARELFNEGAKALDAEKYAVAVDKFKKADELFHAPTMLIGLARAYIGLGKFVEAKETYNRVINEKLPANASDAFLQAQKDAAKEIRGLDDKIGSGTINVTADGGSLPNGLLAKLDDEELKQATFGVKRPMNPGAHRLVVTAPGYTDVERRFDVTPKHDAAIDVRLEKESARETTTGTVSTTNTGTDGATTTTTTETTATHAVGEGDSGSGSGSTQKTLGWAAVGLGGAGLVLGAVTGGLAVSKHSELATLCQDGTCPAGTGDKIDSYKTMGSLSTVGFIAGGVFAATGVVLLVTAPSAPKTGSMFIPKSLAVGPASVRATFEF